MANIFCSPRNSLISLAKISKDLFLKVLVLCFLLTTKNTLLAEGISSIAPASADEAALFIGGGNTGSTGGQYGEFAWKGSDSKLAFNIQNTCEKVYFGFSIPRNNREFLDNNPIFGGSGIDEDLIFRIIDPNGNPINDLACFGNTTIGGEVWQTLSQSDVNISTRAMADNGPTQLGNSGGYTAFELDLTGCGLTLTGNYVIEFYTTNLPYDPNTNRSGFHIEYFDITVADCSNTALTGRVWSNNWCIGIKKDGDGLFDRAFNGAFYVCSIEGFITKIDFNSLVNNRTETGKNNDQRSGFRAGIFNVSFNTTGPANTGNIKEDRKSLHDTNAPNAELFVFLNEPDESFCPLQEVGEIRARNNFLTGCSFVSCINIEANKIGQLEILIEGSDGNGILDQKTERSIIYNITEADRVPNPDNAGFNYQFCIPWDEQDGEGQRLDLSKATIIAQFSQGVYHFPVYDAEFNDDGFFVETIRPALGPQKLFYDDTLIPEPNNTGESKDGTNGCDAPCHIWTGEYEDFANKDDVFGNFNTINTWWFASTTARDLTENIRPRSFFEITCPPDYMDCPDGDIDPSVTGEPVIVDNENCPFETKFIDTKIVDNDCEQVTERLWIVFLADTPENADSCVQLITLKDTIPPVLTCPTDITVAIGNNCEAVAEWAMPLATDNCAGAISIVSTKQSGDVFPIGTTIVTITATDACGNATTCDFRVTVENPTISITCPPDYFGCPGDDTSPMTIGEATVGNTNGCPFRLNYIDLPMGGNSCGSSFRRVWMANLIGFEGQSVMCFQTIVLDDKVAPVLADCPADVTLTSSIDCLAKLNLELPSATDNCSEVIVTSSEDLKGAFPLGETIVTITATDACKNTATCTFKVTVENPVDLACPADIFVECEPNKSDYMVTWTPPRGNECCSSCDPNTQINGYSFLGQRGGHRYYLSHNKVDLATAINEVAQTDGYLAVLTDPAEGNYLANFLSENAYIGLTDKDSEGTFEWLEGTPLNFTNWYGGQPNNKDGNQHAVQLLTNGQWDDISDTKVMHYILEVPCYEVEQIAGPLNGSEFQSGTVSEIAYSITYDNCPNTEFCDFTVTVDTCDYCRIEAVNPGCFWIEQVELGAINNTSGVDGGYGDFRHLSTDLVAGSTQKIRLVPGFPQGHIFRPHWVVWIDYNRNNSYEDEGELLFLRQSSRAIEVEFTVPNDVVAGKTEMRVALKFTDQPDPCLSYVFGEVEDYTINLVSSTRNKLETKLPAENSLLAAGPITNSQLEVYPNPVTDLLNVRISGKNEMGKLRLYDATGRTLLQQPITTNAETSLQLDWTTYKSGIYFLQWQTSEQVIVKKIIKQ